MSNTTFGHRHDQAATVELRKNGNLDASGVTASSSAPAVATVALVSGRDYAIHGVAPGFATIQFTGPGGSADAVGCTVSQDPDTWALTVTLGAITPQS